MRRRPRLVAAFAFLAAGILAVSLAINLMNRQHADLTSEVGSMRCEDRNGPEVGFVRAVRLPLVNSPTQRKGSVGIQCQFEANFNEEEALEPALLIPAVTGSISIQVNGQQVAVAEQYVMRNLRFTNLPVFVPLAPEVIRSGANQFTITLSAPPGRPIAMSPVLFGPRTALHLKYQVRWFTSGVLPTLVVGGATALAMVFGLIWAVRRHEAEYGWLSLFLLLGAAVGSVLIPDFGLGAGPYSIWNMLGLWEATAGLMFMRAVAGLSTKRVHLWFAVPPAVLWFLFLTNPSVFMPNLVIQAGVAVVLGYTLIGQYFLWRAARHGNLEALFILIGMAFVTLFLAHDALAALAVGGNMVFLSRSAMSGLLLAICALMTIRFLRAMTKLDDTAKTLRGQVAYAEQMLKQSYEELRVRREAQAVASERVRLMRDLHDGVGGDLASMLALAGEVPARGAEIARHARAALVDMRLIIGSLEDYGGNLTIALAAWRERAEPQLRAAGITLRWDVDRLPRLPWLGPSQVLDILRIVQETVTNVIKHAQALRLEVTARECDEGVEIALADDGVGISDSPAGNGLRNMAIRAGHLGGRLSVERAAHGTVVRLTIPTIPPTANPPASVP